VISLLACCYKRNLRVTVVVGVTTTGVVYAMRKWNLFEADNKES
jgi:hypothetical protein